PALNAESRCASPSKLYLSFRPVQPKLLTFVRAKLVILLIAIRTNDVLLMAKVVGAVDVAVFRLAAVVAFADNDRLYVIDGHRYPFVENVHFAVKQLSLNLRILSVRSNSAIQLIYLLEALA